MHKILVRLYGQESNSVKLFYTSEKKKYPKQSLLGEDVVSELDEKCKSNTKVMHRNWQLYRSITT